VILIAEGNAPVSEIIIARRRVETPSPSSDSPARPEVAGKLDDASGYAGTIAWFGERVGQKDVHP
jgi:hypothetical protein